MQPLKILQLLFLLALANGAPLAAKKLLGQHLAFALDGGICLGDGRPLFGPSKTVRGIVFAILASSIGAPLAGISWQTGALIGGLAMAGDLLSSFVKRRLAWAPSSRATGLDQVPESLLPLIGCAAALSLTAADIAATTAIFCAGEILLSRLLFRLHFRDRPY